MLGGRYALLDQVGTGGSAVVWRAKDQVLGRTVAVKLLAGPHAGDPESRRRIREEARAAATLSHPNIAQVHDYGESDEGGVCTPYVVMELVRGSTLQQRMAAGPLPPRFAMRVAAEVAAALAAAHADGLVHRDIKPANVMITPDGAKVVDFGIAAAIDPSLAGPPEDEVLGTPAYLAPERLTDGAVEPASDVYALGVLLYRLLSGQAPWSADTTTQMLTAHIYIEPDTAVAAAGRSRLHHRPVQPVPEQGPHGTAQCPGRGRAASAGRRPDGGRGRPAERGGRTDGRRRAVGADPAGRGDRTGRACCRGRSRGRDHLAAPTPDPAAGGCGPAGGRGCRAVAGRARPRRAVPRGRRPRRQCAGRPRYRAERLRGAAGQAGRRAGTTARPIPRHHHRARRHPGRPRRAAARGYHPRHRTGNHRSRPGPDHGRSSADADHRRSPAGTARCRRPAAPCAPPARTPRQRSYCRGRRRSPTASVGWMRGRRRPRWRCSCAARSRSG